jgi:hypothetical protein
VGVLTRFENFGDWNPFIVRALGSSTTSMCLEGIVVPPHRSAASWSHSWEGILGATEDGFRRMNRALKERAEAWR